MCKDACKCMGECLIVFELLFFEMAYNSVHLSITYFTNTHKQTNKNTHNYCYYIDEILHQQQQHHIIITTKQ